VACGQTYLWRGETTWFCCGPGWGPCAGAGGGACGGCRSDSMHAAWPNPYQSCWNITRPDQCGEGGIPRRGCGAVMNVRHQCGATVCVTIRDCGPRTRSFCGELTCCNGQCRSNRIFDMTPAAYAAIGNLSSGKLPVWIYE
jgi:expansin (peptidoglycan-binding protein)